MERRRRRCLYLLYQISLYCRASLLLLLLLFLLHLLGQPLHVRRVVVSSRSVDFAFGSKVHDPDEFIIIIIP